MQFVAQLMDQTGSGSVLQHLSGRSCSVLLSDFARIALAFTFAIGPTRELPSSIPTFKRKHSRHLHTRAETAEPIDRSQFPATMFSIVANEHFPNGQIFSRSVNTLLFEKLFFIFFFFVQYIIVDIRKQDEKSC